MTEPAIVMEDLMYTYPDYNEPVLKNVDLEVNKGSFILIVGKSGSGKSTLARCMNGLIPHLFGGKMEGKVVVNGKDVSRNEVWELAEHVSLIFQNPDSQLFTLTVEDEVAFGPENLGVPRKELEKRVNWALTCIDSRNLRLKPVFNLSDGQKQRVTIAANLSMLSDILVLDEPTSNLDPRCARKLFEILEYLREEKDKTIVLIEHRTNYAAKYVDKVLIMDNGEIKISSSPEILFEEQTLKKFGIRTPNIRVSPVNRSELKKPPIDDPIIEARDLSYSYDGRSALKGIDMKIYKGESVGIIGPNGSGKTTLIKCFIGLLKPTRGKVFVDGIGTKKTTTQKLAEKVGVVLQNPAYQLFMKSVYDEVAFATQNEELSKKRVKNALKVMDLWELKDRHPQSLSEGQKQRLVIAAILARDPKVLILDEPTMGMDGYHMELLVDKLNKLKKNNLTTILVSHDVELISKVANRVVVISDGRVVGENLMRYLKTLDSNSRFDHKHASPDPFFKRSVRL